MYKIFITASFIFYSNIVLRINIFSLNLIFSFMTLFFIFQKSLFPERKKAARLEAKQLQIGMLLNEFFIVVYFYFVHNKLNHLKLEF